MEFRRNQTLVMTMIAVSSLVAFGPGGVAADSDPPPSDEPSAEPDWHDCWFDGPHIPVTDQVGHIGSVSYFEPHHLYNPMPGAVDIIVHPLDANGLDVFVVDPFSCDMRNPDSCRLVGDPLCIAPDVTRYERVVVMPDAIYPPLDSWYRAYVNGGPLVTLRGPLD